jgi:hypothetical protein
MSVSEALTVLGLTTEEIQDLIGAMVSGNSESGIAVSLTTPAARSTSVLMTRRKSPSRSLMPGAICSSARRITRSPARPSVAITAKVWSQIRHRATASALSTARNGSRRTRAATTTFATPLATRALALHQTEHRACRLGWLRNRSQSFDSGSSSPLRAKRIRMYASASMPTTAAVIQLGLRSSTPAQSRQAQATPERSLRVARREPTK